jgi:RNA polymerase sigma-70 factor (ECF subfamily)
VDDTGEFSRLVERLRAGDPAAAADLCRLYGTALRLAVRRRLHPGLRARFDSLDFVHDVWASVLATPPEQLAFETPYHLLGFLTRVASHKVIDRSRQRFGSRRTGGAQEIPIDEPGDDDWPGHLLGRDPTPSQWAIAGDELDRLLSQLPAGHRVIVHRLREGYSHHDIARLANVSVSTVSRVVRRLKELTGA